MQNILNPGNANLRFSDRNASYIPRGRENTNVFRHQQPAAAQRIPFAQQQRSFEGTGRQAEIQNRGGGAPSGFGSSPNRGGQQGPQNQNQNVNNGGGWRRFGENGQQGSPAVNASPRNDGGFRGGNQRAPSLENTGPRIQAAIRNRPPVAAGSASVNRGATSGSSSRRRSSPPRGRNSAVGATTTRVAAPYG